MRYISSVTDYIAPQSKRQNFSVTISRTSNLTCCLGCPS